ncbi:MAG: 16S rRNA (adenine(1518)-N(6)/adenine(1519)-N(6))-dimethyltransferase RsmA [Kiritimatiellia bacterium]|nr:16S rRNA (adenine(1518)-N(6)/adenine(1519)-N(6))-dimethyltransferase RsmA [Kiritimatiellia bacterium]
MQSQDQKLNIPEELIHSLNLTSIADIHRMLDLLKFNPLKSLGQNFLIDANILGIILKTANLSSGDAVLEIGAGLGALTEALARIAHRVVTIEKDFRLVDFLRIRFQPLANIELISADVMRLNLPQLWSSGIGKLVANLPYSIGSAVLVEIFKSTCQPEMIVVTLQVEVARRLAAKPNTGDYGLLSIWGQLSYESKIGKVVSPNCFFPKPEIQSAILCMKKREQSAVGLTDRDFFFALTKYAFGQRRKQLRKILANAPPQFHRALPELQKVFGEMGIDPRARPESLEVEQWVRLANLLYHPSSF